ncbi:MAG: PorV/PorQ family protein, partial [Bacteroidetes bacterium]|nr:PorV/PorQ family protein [Bacteroidota bacterium]
MRRLINKRSKLAAFIALTCLTISAAHAQVTINKVAQSTMNFQLVSISPIASGMGEAYYAVGTGADAIFYNPAGMAEMSAKFNVVLDYTQWIADINYYAGAVAWNLDNYGAIGFSVLSVNYGTINGTSLNPMGGYIDNGPVTNVGAYSVGLTYAKKINTQFEVGGNARLVGQDLGDNTFVNGMTTKNDATKLAFDLGVKYTTLFNDFRFGMAIRNFSSDITRELIAEQLPLTFTMGAAIDLLDFVDKDHSKGTAFTLAVDFLHSNNYSERFNMGVEYKFLGMLALTE